MATFGEIRTLVLDAIARTDDVAVRVVNAAINYAVVMASLTFNPPELLKISDVVLTGGSDRLYFPNLVSNLNLDEESFNGLFELDENGDLMPIAGSTLNTNLLDLVKVFDKTTNEKLDFIPYEQWDTFIPASLVYVKYWTLFGNALIVKATPVNNITLTISYTTYPTQLVNTNENIPFNYHDQYIISSAIGIAFAAFEESDSASMWNQIASFVGSPSALGTKARAIIEGQKVLLENAISSGGTQ